MDCTKRQLELVYCDILRLLDTIIPSYKLCYVPMGRKIEVGIDRDRHIFHQRVVSMNTIRKIIVGTVLYLLSCLVLVVLYL